MSCFRHLRGMRKRAAGGLSAGPESSDEELGSLADEDRVCDVGFCGRGWSDGVGELYQALGGAIAGSMSPSCRPDSDVDVE